MRLAISASLFLGFILNIPVSFFISASSATEQKYIRAVYGNYGVESVGSIIKLLRETEVNAVVLNIKNDDGRVLLEPHHRNLIRRFRDEGAYVICRLVTFKDSNFAHKNPDQAFGSKKTLILWADYRGDHWLDPASDVVKKHILDTAVAGYGAGCDEINFDYIRYPSAIDANVADISFPFTPMSGRSKASEAKREAMKEFFKYAQQRLRPRIYSADLFGYTFLFGSEPSIGQYTEDFARAGFILSGMQYPTHYGCNDAILKIRDPSFYPFVVNDVTLREGIARLSAKSPGAEIRPWIQAFSGYNICRYTKRGCPKGCGEKKAEYGYSEIQKQKDALIKHGICSWMAWNSSSIYSPRLFGKKGVEKCP